MGEGRKDGSLQIGVPVDRVRAEAAGEEFN